MRYFIICITAFVLLAVPAFAVSVQSTPVNVTVSTYFSLTIADPTLDFTFGPNCNKYSNEYGSTENLVITKICYNGLTTCEITGSFSGFFDSSSNPEPDLKLWLVLGPAYPAWVEITPATIAISPSYSTGGKPGYEHGPYCGPIPDLPFSVSRVFGGVAPGTYTGTLLCTLVEM